MVTEKHLLLKRIRHDDLYDRRTEQTLLDERKEDGVFEQIIKTFGE